MAKELSLLMDEALNAYLEELLKAANIASLPEDYKNEYKERLALEVNRRIGIVVMDQLTDKDLEELEKLLEKDSKIEEIQNFLSQRIPNLKEVVEKALDQFAAEFIAAAKK
jgi:predicted house-cleaning noncanonical NTP pyrophosphatase (MazG superfamily)